MGNTTSGHYRINRHLAKVHITDKYIDKHINKHIDRHMDGHIDKKTITKSVYEKIMKKMIEQILHHHRSDIVVSFVDISNKNVSECLSINEIFNDDFMMCPIIVKKNVYFISKSADNVFTLKSYVKLNLTENVHNINITNNDILLDIGVFCVDGEGNIIFYKTVGRDDKIKLLVNDCILSIDYSICYIMYEVSDDILIKNVRKFDRVKNSLSKK